MSNTYLVVKEGEQIFSYHTTCWQSSTMAVMNHFLRCFKYADNCTYFFASHRNNEGANLKFEEAKLYPTTDSYNQQTKKIHTQSPFMIYDWKFNEMIQKFYINTAFAERVQNEDDHPEGMCFRKQKSTDHGTDQSLKYSGNADWRKPISREQHKI